MAHSSLSSSKLYRSGGVVTIGNYAHFGDFRTEIYGNTVNIDYDTDTNVTVAVIEQEPTPL